jgi:preprotein translocase subunit YajC
MFLSATLLPVALYAEPAANQGSKGMFGSVMPMMVVMFVVIYFLMIRPEQKKQKLRQKMISEMKKGDRVLTAGGIYGSIQNVKNDVVVVKIADDTNVEVLKSAVSSVVVPDTQKKDSESKEGK